LETLKITDKLENINNDKLREILVAHDKNLGKTQQLGEDVLVSRTRKSTTEKGVYFTKGNEYKGNEHQDNSSQYSNWGHLQGRGRGRGNMTWTKKYSKEEEHHHSQSNGRGRGKKMVTCFYRIKIGHYASDCRIPYDHIGKQKDSYLAQYVNTKKNENCEYVFTTLQQIEITNLVQKTYSFRSDFEDAWIMDSGATQHMTYKNYQDFHLSSFFLADDTTHILQGKCSVKVFLPRIGESIISIVWYIPSFKRLCFLWFWFTS